MHRSACLWWTAAIALLAPLSASAQHQSAGRLFNAAEGHEKRERWVEAGECYERALAQGWDARYSPEGDFTLCVGDEVQARIAAWPEAGWRAYQANRGIGATARLDDAVARRDTAEVLVIAGSAFATCAGARAAMIHARGEYEAGRFASAVEWARRLYSGHPALRPGVDSPEEVPSRAEAIALAVLCERRLLGPYVVGEAAAELARIPPRTLFDLGGREMTAGELVAGWTPTPRASEEASVDPLSLAARGADGGAAVDSAGPTYSRWTLPMRESNLLVSPNMEGFQGALAPCFLGLAPTVHGEDLLLQDGSRLWCVDLQLGKPRWQFPPAGRVDTAKRRRRSGLHWADEVPRTVAIYDGTAIATLCLRREADGLHSKSYYEGPLALDLVAVDLATGLEAWSSVDWADPALADAGFLSNPVIRDGVVYAFAARLSDAKTVSRAIVAVDVADGRVRWHTGLPDPAPLKDESREFERKLGHCARIDEEGGRLFVLANDGLCLCVDRETGVVLWRTIVETNALALWAQSFRTESLFTGPSPLALLGTTLLVVPFGGGPLYALDASTGKERWSLPGEAAFLVGVSEGRAVLVGETLSCVDVVARKTLWTFPLQGALSGRPALAESVVFVPLLEGIAAVELATGPKADPAVQGSIPLLAAYQSQGRGYGWRSCGGQLAVTEGRLVATSTDGVQAWATRKGIEAEAAARIARDPKDADAWALRADMAWAVGDQEKACDDYEQAARVIDSSEAGARGKLRKRALDRVYTLAADAGKKALAAKPPEFATARKAYLRALDAAQGPEQSRHCLLSLLTAAKGQEDKAALVELIERVRADHPWAMLPWDTHPLAGARDGGAPGPSIRSTQPAIWSLASVWLAELGVREREDAARALSAALAGEGVQALATVAASWPETVEAAEARAAASRRIREWGNDELAASLLGEPRAAGSSTTPHGELRLSRTLPRAAVWTVDGETYLAVVEDRLGGWDLSSGEERWRIDVERTGTPSMILSSSGRGILVGERIRAFDMKSGEAAWEAEGAPRVELVDGLIFATSERRARAIEARTGATIWEQAIGKENAYASVAWVDARPLSDRMMVWASGPVRVLDLLTGMPVCWVHALQPRPGLNLAVLGGTDGVLAYVEETNNALTGTPSLRPHVAGVRRSDGRPLWSRELPADAGSARLLTASPSGGYVLVGTEDGSLRMLDGADGRERACHRKKDEAWLPLGATAERLPIPGAEELLVVACQSTGGSREVTLAGWDLAEGTLRWRIPLAEKTALATVAREAAVAEGAEAFALALEQVKEGRREVRVVCVSKRDGAVMLREDVPFDDRRPRVELSGGRVLVSAADGLRVYGPGK